MPSQHINLFQNKTTLQPLFAKLERYLKTGSLIFLSIVFSGGIMVGVAFLVFGQQRDAMESKRQQLLSQVKQQENKEAMVMMIRNRIGAIDAIVNSQVSYAPFIDTTMRVTQSFPLSSFVLGAKNTVIISVNVSTLDEAVRVLSTLLDMEQKHQIANPVLQSFSLNDKNIQIGLSYVVVL